MQATRLVVGGRAPRILLDSQAAPPPRITPPPRPPPKAGQRQQNHGTSENTSESTSKSSSKIASRKSPVVYLTNSWAAYDIMLSNSRTARSHSCLNFEPPSLAARIRGDGLLLFIYVGMPNMFLCHLYYYVLYVAMLCPICPLHYMYRSSMLLCPACSLCCCIYYSPLYMSSMLLLVDFSLRFL